MSTVKSVTHHNSQFGKALSLTEKPIDSQSSFNFPFFLVWRSQGEIKIFDSVVVICKRLQQV